MRAMTPAVDQILQQAVAAHRKGATEDAERLYRQVLSLDPRSEAACGNLAIIAAQQGDLAAAEGLFRRAPPPRPAHPPGPQKIAPPPPRNGRAAGAVGP